MAYREIQRIKLENGDRIWCDRNGTEMVVARIVPDPEPREVDVTAECSVELRKSSSSGGHYVAIVHGDRVRFALGVDEKSKIIPFQSSRYHIEHAEGATVSFRVTKRV